MNRNTFAVFALIAIFASTSPVSGQDVENICGVVTFNDVAPDLVEDIYEECVSSSTPDGVPLELANRLEREAYKRLVEAGLVERNLGNFSLSASSEYFGGNRAVFYDGPVIRNSLTLFFPKGVYGNFWFSTGLDNAEVWEDFDDEVNLTVGWAGSLGSYNLDLGVSYFAIVEILPADVVQPYLEVSRTFQAGQNHALTPYGKLEYYFPTEGSEPAKGFIGRLGLRHSWQLSDLTSLNCWGAGFYDTGAFGFESGVLYEGGVSLGWNLEGSTLSIPEVTCGTPHGRFNDGREEKCVVGFSWNRDF